MTPCLSEPHFLHWQSFAWEYMCVCRLMDACVDAHIYGSQKSALGLVVTQTLSSLMFLGLLLAWISLVRARLAVTC